MAEYSNYPNKIDTSTELPLATDKITPVKAEAVNRLRDAILAVEKELGTNPSGTASTVKDRLDQLESRVTDVGVTGPQGEKGDKGDKGDTGESGAPGQNGSNAYTTVSVSFTQPAVSFPVSVTVGDNTWMSPGQTVYVQNGGYYTVNSKFNTNTVSLTNLGYPGNASPGSTIANTSMIVAAGIRGATGTTGATGADGQSAYTLLIDDFTQPANGDTVNIHVGSSSFLIANFPIAIDGIGLYFVTAIPDSTHLTIQNVGGTSKNPGDPITGGRLLVIVGYPGSDGSPGANGSPGVNAYTGTSGSFVQPANGVGVSVTVQDSSWMVVGQVVYLSTGGYYQVMTINSSTNVTLDNLAYPGNVIPGNLINAGKLVPGGLRGATGATGSSGATGPAYVFGALVSDSISDPRTTSIFYNDTGSSVLITNLYFIPTDSVTASDTNYWTVSLTLSSAPTTPVVQFTTQVTGGTSLTAWTAVSFGGNLTVPNGETAILRIVPTNFPTALGGRAQGRAGV